MTGLSGYDIEIVDRVSIQIESNENNKVLFKNKQEKLDTINSLNLPTTIPIFNPSATNFPSIYIHLNSSIF